MAGQNNRFTLGLLLLKQPVNIPYTVLVQPVEGLVQDQRGGVFHDGLGDAQPLPHSQRIFAHRLFVVGVKAYQTNDFINASLVRLA